MNLKIKVKRLPEWKLNLRSLITLTVAISLLCPIIFHSSALIKLVYDVIVLFFVLFIIAQPYARISDARYRIKNTNRLPAIFIVFYYFVIIISGIGNEAPFHSFILDLRLAVPGMLFWYVCILGLDTKYYESIKDMFLGLCHVNFAVTLFEFIVLHEIQDRLGGIFGLYVGVNTLTNVFICIVTIIALQKAFQSKITIFNALIIVAENIIVASLAELKVFYVELIVIYITLFLLNRFSIKTILCVVAGVGIFTVGLRMLYYYQPYYAGFFTLDGIIDSFNNAYSTNRGLTRGTGIPYIETHFLNSIFQRYFGLGVGNVNFSSTPLLSSEFYERYGYLKYNWFAHIYKFTESGWLGIITFIGFYVSHLICVDSHQKNINMENMNIAKTLAVVCIIFFVYDTTLMNQYTMFLISLFLASMYAYDDGRKNL